MKPFQAEASPRQQVLHRRTTCRLCDGENLGLALPMRSSPIGDAYVPAARLGESQGIYPLDLYLCRDCGHLQNLDVVNPEELFRNYLFTTGSSAGLVEHFHRYASSISSNFLVKPGSFIVEIGSNDGTLLKFFKALEMRVLGIDPAREIAWQAASEGVETLPEFFGYPLAVQIRKKYGPASVVCANNAFAHADDLADIVRGVHALLAHDGVFVFEASYLVDIVDHFLFDTIYHEHVSHHTIAPLAKFFNRLGLQLFDIQPNSSKGGSIRGFVQHANGPHALKPVVGEMIAAEKTRGFQQSAIYRDYAAEIEKRRMELASFLDGEIAQGKMIAGYGASTTTTTLMWNFDLTRKLAFVADDNPKKQGLYCPACHIPVVPSGELYVRRPEVVVILAWQYAPAILKRHEPFINEGGKFAIPLPALRILP